MAGGEHLLDMIYGHLHCIDTCPLSLTHTCTLMSHDSPESSITHRISVGRRHTHMCSSHPTLRTSKKQNTSRTFYFSSHVTHLYYYSCGERSLGIVYCTLSLVVRYTGKEEVHARTRPLTHASIFLEKEDDDPWPLHLGVTHANY